LKREKRHLPGRIEREVEAAAAAARWAAARARQGLTLFH